MKTKTAKVPLAGPRSVSLFRQDERALLRLAQRTNRSVNFFVREWVHQRLARLKTGNGIPPNLRNTAQPIRTKRVGEA
jgi:hypothetical protein